MSVPSIVEWFPRRVPQKHCGADSKANEIRDGGTWRKTKSEIAHDAEPLYINMCAGSIPSKT